MYFRVYVYVAPCECVGRYGRVSVCVFVIHNYKLLLLYFHLSVTVIVNILISFCTALRASVRISVL